MDCQTDEEPPLIMPRQGPQLRLDMKGEKQGKAGTLPPSWRPEEASRARPDAAGRNYNSG